MLSSAPPASIYSVWNSYFASSQVRPRQGWMWVLLPSAVYSALCYFSSFHLPFQLLFNLLCMHNEWMVSLFNCEHFGAQTKASCVFVKHQPPEEPMLVQRPGFYTTTNKQTSKQETSLQMSLSMHPKVPIRIGTFVFSICILALASCIFTASSR